MNIMRKMLSLLLTSLLLASLLAGCGKKEEDAQPFELRVSTCGALETLDPAMSTDVGAESLLSALFEGLMRLRDDGTGKAEAVAGIAREYIEEKNYDDTVTYTFLLRSSARWSDGKRVKAADFVYAWRRLADPATASPNAELLRMVKGYDEARESGDMTLLGVTAKDESTLIVTLSEPCSYFIGSVCTAPATAPLREDLVTANENWASGTDIVTDGPYCVAEWRWGDYVLMQRNDEYYESRLVLPDQLSFRFEDDTQTNYEQYLAGELDYIDELPYEAIREMAEDESWRPAPLAEVRCVLYNHLTDTFSDAALRCAFDLAIDRAALAEQVGVMATEATGCVPYGITNVSGSADDFRTAGGELCAVDAEGYAERSAEAARKIAAAGHYQGAGLDRLEFLCPEGAENRAIAASLRDMWKRVLGVEVDLVEVDEETLAQRLSSGEYDLALTSLTGRCDDAMEYLEPFRGTSENNVSGYRNETFDLLIGVAESTGDLTARAAFLHDAEVMLLEDNALSPLYFCGTAYALRDGYKGVYHDCFGHSYFTAVTADEAA